MEATPHTGAGISQYEIQTSASIVEVPKHALKHGDTFALLDPHGDILRIGNKEQGFYHEGTRFLSRLEMRLEGRRPVLLGSAVRKDNTLLAVDLTNPDCKSHNGNGLQHGLVHVFRSSVVLSGSLYQHIRLRNFADRKVSCDLRFNLDADFADMFEVRGMKRDVRGEHLPDEREDAVLTFSYRGRDEVVRSTVCRFEPPPKQIIQREARYSVDLEPGTKRDIYLVVTAEGEMPSPAPIRYEDALKRRRLEASVDRYGSCRLTTSHEQFNEWLERTAQDLNLLLTKDGGEVYPYAGIPWYNTYFGRDGIITALMTLWINPEIARGVLSYLARTQSMELNAERAAEPGKILHEARTGEMSATGEVPFGRYYGTVDATPLFVVLAGEYLRYTDDRAFLRELWPNIQHALDWLDDYGDVDGDGFVEYRAHKGGLTQQGWKDSDDSVFHEDGSDVEGPIALCEVQGYVYQARLNAAEIAETLGNPPLASEQRRRAAHLRRQFCKQFWLEDLGTLALALDGDKKPCRVNSSNAGHALFSGIVDESHARHLAATFRSPDMFSGWGIRTLSERERRFNPMSYHNGSVWPHDNGLIALGLGSYGYREDVHRILKAFFDASLYDRELRLPELFCGFERRSEEGPTPYPVACSPQAWATVTVYALLQASLGLSISAKDRRVTFKRPTLPDFLERVRLNGLRVGEARLDVALQRHEGSVGVEILKREGDAEVITIA